MLKGDRGRQEGDSGWCWKSESKLGDTKLLGKIFPAANTRSRMRSNALVQASDNGPFYEHARWRVNSTTGQKCGWMVMMGKGSWENRKGKRC